jgi:hypothetical protein
LTVTGSLTIRRAAGNRFMALATWLFITFLSGIRAEESKGIARCWNTSSSKVFSK